ncbi:MAG: hypothetical protein HUU60_07020 [Armatimonadetes bacterium]|nr:hypothetical protein [Armatimonadota bacterium]
MKSFVKGLTIAAMATWILGSIGCGGGSGIVVVPPPEGRGVRIDLTVAGTGAPLTGAEVHYVMASGGVITSAQFVESTTTPGTYEIADLPTAGTLMGVWINTPAGFHKVVRQVADPSRGIPQRVIQFLNAFNAGGCLLANGRQQSDFVAGTTHLGRVDLYQNTAGSPPPPAMTESCP